MTLRRMSNMGSIYATSFSIDGKQYLTYEDAAYSLRPCLKIRFSNTSASEEQRIFNALMSAVREAEEWNYKEIKLYFTS